MKKLYFLLFCLLSTILLNAQEIKLESSNSSLPFQDFISGVNVALIELSPELQQQVDEGNHPIVNQLAVYIQQLGITNIGITTSQKNRLFNAVPSFCDMVQVKMNMMPSVDGSTFVNHSLTFTSCLGDYFTFSSPDAVVNKGQSTLQELTNLWKAMYGQRATYQPHRVLKMPESKMTRYTELSLDNYFAGSADPIEGKYEKKLGSHANKSAYRIGVIKNKVGSYDVVYLKGATNYKDWKEGELMGQIDPKGTQHYHTAAWRLPNKVLNHEAFVSLDKNGMLILSFKNNDKTYEYFKVLNTELPVKDLITSSGTAFAISQSGHLLTSYHLIKDASQIDVELNGRRYDAIVLKKDATNDLAIVKIEDAAFRQLAPIPYRLKGETSEVGESVFTLGYPMSSTMGREVKLAKGIISSLSGYKDNLSVYQIGMSIYGGNSGGPLFDKEGYLIGIIKARHSDAENASYAIKAHNAMNIMDSLAGTDFSQTNQLAGLDLPEQVKSIKEFVFQLNAYK